MNLILLSLAIVLPTENQKETYEAAMRARERCCLKPQTLDPELCKIAQKWAEQMAATNCMYHGGGEQIIAKGYRTPESVVNAWMNSDGHRRWILSKCSRVGFGYARSKSGHPYWAGVYRN